jgi:hypothetical protein
MKNNSIATATNADKFQNNIGYFFIGIWICTLIGFHNTYTIFFPAFEKFHWQHHYHGAMMMCWLIMLMVQPFLIKYGKYKTHRTLGKLGYVLAPLVVYSLFVITKFQYYHWLGAATENVALAMVALSIPDIFSFGLLFALAMIHRHKPSVHARYMIGTALLILGPGVGRIFIRLVGLPPFIGIHIAVFIMDILALLLLFHDFRKSINIKPALTIVIVLAIKHFCFASQNAIWWQKFAKWFAMLFF